MEYIHSHLHEQLSLQKLSEVSYFSPYHFHRIFNAFIGEPPNSYVNRLRVERAAKYLSSYPNSSITEAAFQCGFSSSASFSRAFKKHFTISATNWKNSKIRKTGSKIGKEESRKEDYVSDVNNTSLNRIERIEMNIEVKEMPSFHVAYLTHFEGYNYKIGKLFDRLCYWASPRGLLKPDTKFIGISLDDPEITPKDKCRYNACISVSEDIKPEGEIQMMDIPASKCIVYKFAGKEEDISKMYNYVYGVYLIENGFQPKNIPGYEIYENDPQKDPKGIFKMTVCIPVEPIK